MGIVDMFRRAPAFAKAADVAGHEGVAQLVPRLKTNAFHEALAALGVPADQMPVMEPFVGDLHVAYAFDTPNMFRMASRNDFERLEITLDDARTHARNNLFDIVGKTPFKMTSSPLFHEISLPDLAACLMLVPTYGIRFSPNTSKEKLRLLFRIEMSSWRQARRTSTRCSS